MSLVALDRSTTPPTPRELEVDNTGALRVTGAAEGGGSSGGLTNTELRTAAARYRQAQPLSAGAATAANQATANAALGAPADALAA